jgi:UDP-GlcNAc:undecaprenyl-phosphate GlcNAc-1-phosphate transferase
MILLTALATLLVAPLITSLAQRAGLLDTPGIYTHKQHSRPTPASGGLILVVVLSAAAVLSGWHQEPVLVAILAPALIVFAFGLLDDLRGLPPWAKLAVQTLATILMIMLGAQVKLFPANWLNLLVTTLWMVGITNAFNFVDSKDGLALGLACLAAAFYLLATRSSGQMELSLLSASLLGAGAVCYYYNSQPALFFLGDSGSQLLGFLLAGLSISYNPLGYELWSTWFIPILLMGVPVFDLTLVVISRLRRGLPVYQAGLDHTYHRLAALGLGSERAVMTMHAASFILSVLALSTLGLPTLISNAIFLLLLLLGGACIFVLDQRDRWH